MSYPTDRVAALLTGIGARGEAMCMDGKTALAAAQDTLAEVRRLDAALADAKEQVRHVADDLDKAADAIKQMAANHRTDIPALLEELNRLRAEARMLRTKVTRQELELAELDRENATLAGRANLAEEQLTAATLQEGQL